MGTASCVLTESILHEITLGGYSVSAFLSVFFIATAITGCTNNPDDGAAEQTEVSAIPSAQAENYVPASADGPAQNVPEPNMSAKAIENSIDGAKKLVASDD